MQLARDKFVQIFTEECGETNLAHFETVLHWATDENETIRTLVGEIDFEQKNLRNAVEKVNEGLK